MLVWPAAAAEQNRPEDPDEALLRVASRVQEQVVAIRGLQPLGPIRKGVRSREEISRYLRRRVEEEYTEKDIAREETVLKKLGLLPPAMDYKEFTLRLLSEQVGGYYDPEEKILFIAGWLNPALQEPVMAHELTHALQDQHFNLKAIIRDGRSEANDDRLLARQSVVEGDGLAVMLEYVLQPAGMSFTGLPDIASVMRAQLSSMDAEFPLFREAPSFLKQSLLFPYTYGASFLQKVRARDTWSAVDHLYRDLPVSSEQILHPEKYLNRRENPVPVESADPAAALGSSWRTRYRNVLGEFTLYLLLKLFLSEEEASRASVGWGGDRILLTEETGGSASLVSVESVWDSDRDAEEFFDAMDQWMIQRFPAAKRSASDSAARRWEDGTVLHVLRRNGKTVTFLIDLPRNAGAKLAASSR